MKKKCKVIALPTSDNDNFALYIISDDKLEISDYYIDKFANSIELCEKHLEADMASRFNCYKVIASTDPSLNLPAIPEWFVKEYAKKQTSEVLIEYQSPLDEFHIKLGEPIQMKGIDKPVVIPHIALHYTEKQNWTKDEVEFVLSNAPGIAISSLPYWFAHMIGKFDSVEQDMRKFKEDQRADAYKHDFEELFRKGWGK